MATLHEVLNTNPLIVDLTPAAVDHGECPVCACCHVYEWPNQEPRCAGLAQDYDHHAIEFADTTPFTRITRDASFE